MDYGHKETDNILDNLTKELQELYGEAYKEIEKKYLYNKYLINHLSKVGEAKDLERLYRNDEKLKAQLKALSDDITNANKQAYKMINGELLNVYELNYNYGAYTVEHGSGLEVYHNLYNRNIVKKILAENENPFTLIALDEMLDKDVVYRDLKRKFLVQIINGGSIKDIAKAIEDIVEKSLNDAIRIARTETTRLESMGRQDSFQDGANMGIKMKKVWISTNDKRTRDRHLKMQGEAVGLDERFSNGLLYPGEFGGRAAEVINCRCSHVAELEGVEKSAELKELEERLKNANFQEWENRKKSKK